MENLRTVDDYRELEDALYNLQSFTQLELNPEWVRRLWKVLQNLDYDKGDRKVMYCEVERFFQINEHGNYRNFSVTLWGENSNFTPDSAGLNYTIRKSDYPRCISIEELNRGEIKNGEHYGRMYSMLKDREEFETLTEKDFWKILRDLGEVDLDE